MNLKTVPFPRVDLNVKTSVALISTTQSTLLLFCLFFPLAFMELILHEGGHALNNLIQGSTIDVFYAHPFTFNGYVRPFSDVNTVWRQASGVVASLLISLVIFVFYWRRRSVSNLPLVMLFPWIALKSGFAIINIAGHTGDYYNILMLTHLPTIFFYGLGFLFFVLGIFFFISLFPLLGFDPDDKKNLIAVPISTLLWSGVSILVAYLSVPGSPIDLRYHLKDEILLSANTSLIFGVLLGLFLAGIYISLYHKIYPKLPTGLRSDKASISWRSFLKPGILLIICLVLGIASIR